MGLANIKKKSESLGKKSNSSFLKINMYENPKMALDLISHICTSGKKIDITNFFESYEEKIIELKNKTADYSYLNTNFFNCLFSIKNNIVNDLIDNHKSVLKIAVGGGYSAGKSSFINAITSIGNLLPTGIEPVSIVNTHLNCLESAKSITINGRNIKNEIVSLNEEVLSCIQHSSKSKVYIASVLNDILIDVPSSKWLNGITFVDTPGYNNSLNTNKENNLTDFETAKMAIEKADVLFWCIDIDAGTISASDLKFLNSASKKPIVIFFTKGDKKPADEIKKIVSAANDICKKNINNPIVDIIAVSSVGNTFKIIHSSRVRSLEKLITDIKNRQLKNNTIISLYREFIDKFFKYERQYLKQNIATIDEERQKICHNLIRNNDKNKRDNDLKKEQELVKEIGQLKKIQEILDKYNSILITEFDYSYSLAFEYVEELLKTNKIVEHVENTDIFSAIASDNYRRFLACFSKGVDLTICNNEGYNPITYATRYGNNEMIRFFIEKSTSNGIDLSIKDKNGNNALETAAIYHYEDICRMLIKHDKELLNKSRSLVELAKNDYFVKWISQFEKR